MTVDYGDRWLCSSCGALSAKCYRCQSCGMDFASEGVTAALQRRPGGST